MPDERPVRLRRRTRTAGRRELALDVVVAARRREDSGASHRTARASASSVAVSHACSASTMSGDSASETSPIRPSTNSVSGRPAELRGDLGVVLAGLGLGVDTRDVRRPSHGCASGARTSPTSERRCRTRGRRPAADAVRAASPATSSECRGRAPAGTPRPDVACRRSAPRTPNSGSSGASSVRETRSWRRVLLARSRRCRWTCASPFLVTRSCTVSVVVSTCQLPYVSAERAVDHDLRRGAVLDVLGPRLRAVPPRDEQPTPRLQVDRAQLEPLVGRRQPRRDAGPTRPHVPVSSGSSSSGPTAANAGRGVSGMTVAGPNDQGAERRRGRPEQHERAEDDPLPGSCVHDRERTPRR